MQPMNKVAAFLVALLLLPALPAQAEAPIGRVISLLTELKSRIEADGRSEQSMYDSYACWCETTLAEKAGEVTQAKDMIEALQTGVIELKGELGSHTAQIAQLKKGIAANIQSQRETEELRQKENAEYQEEKTETEQCIGALEAAIRVLSGTGTGTKGFLETLQEARLMSVVAGVRGVLTKPSVSRAVSANDLKVVKRFVDNPEDFVHDSGMAMSAAQIAQNPYGDYAPQSTQIQGILKSMYDSFTADLEKDNAEEASKQKSYEDLMATKRQELQTLQATLDVQEHDEATKSRQVAEDKSTLDDTKEQLDADEAFFAETKTACKTKASEWAERSRLRTEELHSITKAIAILSSEEATHTFTKATSLLQLATIRSHDGGSSQISGDQHPGRAIVYKSLQALATRSNSLALAHIAVSVQTGGHFTSVINEIDRMIEVLRSEEQDDIAHRDRCQENVRDNTHNMEDINHDISKVDGQLGRLTTTQSQLNANLLELEGSINATADNIEQVKALRAEELTKFRESLQYDHEAIALLEQAIAVLSRFYQANGLPMELVETGSHLVGAPAAAPPPIWHKDYGGRQAESTGIIAILSLLKEDFEKEIMMATQANEAASQAYVKELNSLQKTLEAQTASRNALDKQLAELQFKKADLNEEKNQKGLDLQAEEARQAALYTDCSWVKSHFESRRTKRKTEIEGLIDAKNFLQGMEDQI